MALRGEAQVDVHHLVFRDGAAHHKKGRRLQPRLGQVLLRQGGSQGNVRQNLFRLQHGAEAEHLAVHSGCRKAHDAHQFPEFFLRYLAGRVVAPVTPVAVQQGIQRRMIPENHLLL